jgi:hypothetical protein
MSLASRADLVLDLIARATIVGGAKLVEFLSNDGTGVSY